MIIDVNSILQFLCQLWDFKKFIFFINQVCEDTFSQNHFLFSIN